MTALFLISITIFIAYNVSIAKIYGVPNSLSESFYSLKEHNLGFLFTIFCWSMAFPLLIYWIEHSPSDWNFLPFISCAGLMFVGTAAAFKGHELEKKVHIGAVPAFKGHELEKKVHVGAALICAASSYIWTILYASLFLSINFILLSILLYFLLKKNKTYWIEMLAFVNLYIQLLL